MVSALAAPAIGAVGYRAPRKVEASVVVPPVAPGTHPSGSEAERDNEKLLDVLRGNAETS